MQLHTNKKLLYLLHCAGERGVGIMNTREVFLELISRRRRVFDQNELNVIWNTLYSKPPFAGLEKCEETILECTLFQNGSQYIILLFAC